MIGMMAIILLSTKMVTTMTAIVNIVDDHIITMTKSTAGREITTVLIMLTPFLNR